MLLKQITIIFLICLLALFLRIKLFPYKTHWSDMYFWMDWGKGVVEQGTKKFYQQFAADYLPLYPLVLGLVYQIYNGSSIFQNIPLAHFYKLPAAFFDLLTGLLIYLFLRKKTTLKKNLLYLSFFLFNPAIFANSSMWGQVDVVGTFFCLLALFLERRRKYFFSGISFGFAFSTKPLYILAVPVLFIDYLQREKPAIKQILTKIFFFTAGSLGLCWLLSSFFVDFQQAGVFQKLIIPLRFLFNKYKHIAQRYPYTSVNAFNFWGLVEKKFWLSDLRTINFFTLHTLGLAMGALFFLIILLRSLTIKTSTLFYKLNLSLVLIFMAAFLFMTRMHERHLFYVFPFLLLAAFKNRRLLFAYFLLSFLYLLNLHFGIQYYYQNKEYVFGLRQINLFSSANLLVFGWLFIEYLKVKTDEI